MNKYLRIYRITDMLFEVIAERDDNNLFEGTLAQCENFINEVCSL